MLSPLLSSWNNHLLRSESHFGTFLDFGPMFLDFSHFGWKSPLEQMFCWITSGLAVGLCYLLFYPLKITTFRDQNHILEHFWILAYIFGFFPLWLKSPLEQMFRWITSGLSVWLCYLLFYPLEITTFRNQNHILEHFWIFWPYFWIFPTLTEKVH